MDGGPTLERITQGDGLALCAAGAWTARFAPVLERIAADAEQLGGTRPNIFIDVSQVSKLDTFGAWLIERLRRSLTHGDIEANIAGLSAGYASLVNEVQRVKAVAPPASTSMTALGLVEDVGRTVVGFGTTIVALVGFVAVLGAVSVFALMEALHYARRTGTLAQY